MSGHKPIAGLRANLSGPSKAQVKRLLEQHREELEADELRTLREEIMEQTAASRAFLAKNGG
jgi:hypothetical protein